MRRAFLDSDIILDFISGREPHFFAAERIFELIDGNIIRCSTSPIVVSNLTYILHRQGFSRSKIIRLCQDLISLLDIITTSHKTMSEALNSEIKDIEDAFQAAIAKNGGCDCIVTRNIKDYKKSMIPAYTPAEFISSVEEKI